MNVLNNAATASLECDWARYDLQHPRQTHPEGTEQRALITQGSRCHVVTVKPPVPRCHAVPSPATTASEDNSGDGSASSTDAKRVP